MLDLTVPIVTYFEFLVMQPRIAAAETIAGFNEEKPSQFVEAPLKTIVHPGEVSLHFYFIGFSIKPVFFNDKM